MAATCEPSWVAGLPDVGMLAVTFVGFIVWEEDGGWERKNSKANGKVGIGVTASRNIGLEKFCESCSRSVWRFTALSSYIASCYFIYRAFE